MRSQLFKIPFAGSLDLGGWQVPVFGFGLVLLVWCLAGAVALILKLRKGQKLAFDSGVVTWLVAAGAIIAAPTLVTRGILPREWPVFGFGLMLFLGFFSAAQLAAFRFQRRGLDPEIPWDVAFWGVPAGIIGARIFHVVQYYPDFRENFFPRVFMLWDGGLVFYGGLVTGVLAFFAYCRYRNLDPLNVGDLLVPSLFVGLGFGRIGCFLNGCCYGDFCSQPWAVPFPQGSHPYRVQVDQGYLSGTEPWSLPLHPTQLYSALDAFVWMGLTLAYYPYRQRRGDVIVLGMAGHAISRFLIEIVRNDEKGQFGTTLTISQWISILMFLGAIYLWSRLHSQPPGSLSPTLPATVAGPSESRPPLSESRSSAARS